MNMKLLATLAAGIALTGCAASQTSPAQPPASGEPAEPPAPTANAQPAGVHATVAADGAADVKRRAAEDVAPTQVAAAAPPPPEGAPPSWLAKAPSAYRAGEAFQYLPKDCRERVYIDAGSIIGADAADVKAAVEQVIKGIGSPREEARVKKVITIVRDEGADPIATWREIAVCAEDRDVIAISFAGDKPIEVPVLVQKVKLALGDGPGAVVRKGDLSMLVAPDGETFAQPAPHVFLIGKNKEALLAAIEKKAGAAGFAAARGQLIFAKGEEVDATVKQTGDKIDIGFTVHLRGGAATRAKKDPKEFTAKAGEKLKDVADRLKGTPLEPFGERLRAVKVAARGADIVVNGDIKRSSLVSMLKGMGPNDLEKLMKAFK